MNDAKVITFPKPKTQVEKCLRWIKACGRPHEQLNVTKIDVNKVVCFSVYKIHIHFKWRDNWHCFRLKIPI
ncbi:hypothetical protein DPMN_068066 [Dreissena polymorpha]|uniref:Uncharacterized protein n=1 Tax=Dreissena polymorpha TaxID=45954 RepID=A0A9D3Z0E4_DREPO|nr:hypothetical protein DPMN_068066 [Dreissena polymorpha]